MAKTDACGIRSTPGGKSSAKSPLLDELKLLARRVAATTCHMSHVACRVSRLLLPSRQRWQGAPTRNAGRCTVPPRLRKKGRGDWR